MAGCGWFAVGPGSILIPAGQLQAVAGGGLRPTEERQCWRSFLLFALMTVTERSLKNA